VGHLDAADVALVQEQPELLVAVADQELARLALRLEDLQPVADAELGRRLADDVQVVELFEQLAQAALVLEPEQAVQRRAIAVGVDDAHAVASRARERAAEARGDGGLPLPRARARDHDRLHPFGDVLLDRGRERIEIRLLDAVGRPPEHDLPGLRPGRRLRLRLRMLPVL